jgi:hypothetical protein
VDAARGPRPLYLFVGIEHSFSRFLRPEFSLFRLSLRPAEYTNTGVFDSSCDRNPSDQWMAQLLYHLDEWLTRFIPC